ncbi:MAG TPA: HDIG domain-containing protein [Bacillota bacterium]|nr:HDIG domain-containing protein [Bacillota bacterium]HPT88603.1 HDIG domain-containing protein [Bacillota bacterium]
MVPTREEALQLLKKYTHSESLIKHALTVEAVMRHFASVYGEDPDKWGIIGLVHDLDYEAWPEEHCWKSRTILEEAGWPEEYIRAVVSHGWGICSDVEPVSKMEKVLYTIDELTGLITATVLVRPSKSILDLQVSSVKKKWKDKAFAAGANRAVIEKGVQMLEADLNDIIGMTIEGMKSVAKEIGLEGIPA